MVKDTRPIDSENSFKSETVEHASDVNESAQELHQTSEVGSPLESVSVQPSVESGTGEEVMPSVVGETSSGGRFKVSRRTPKLSSAKMDRLEEEIEDILEEDLKEMYLEMPVAVRAEFREKGEVTRSKIRVLVRSAKVNAKKVFLLIRDWLKGIPGVNRFFLEQEAKIKTDKILSISEEEQKRTQKQNDLL